MSSRRLNFVDSIMSQNTDLNFGDPGGSEELLWFQSESSVFNDGIKSRWKKGIYVAYVFLHSFLERQIYADRHRQ